MLDGAGYNAPVFDDGDGKPVKPDGKTDPVGLLRWQLTHDHKRPPEEVEKMCARFEADIAAGVRVWDEGAGDWVVV